MSFLEYIGSVGGIGAILAVIVFIYTRYLINQMREDRKFMEDRLTTLLGDYKEVCKDQSIATKENAKALTELTTYLKMENKK
ncbi:MAG: hypothetical protein ACWGQW_00310 [bacterium]